MHLSYSSVLCISDKMPAKSGLGEGGLPSGVTEFTVPKAALACPHHGQAHRTYNAEGESQCQYGLWVQKKQAGARSGYKRVGPQ